MVLIMAVKSDSGFAETAYYLLIGLSLAVIAAFSWMTYIFYTGTQGTPAFKFTILIPLPVLVSLLLLILLLSAGKKAVAAELRNFMSKN